MLSSYFISPSDTSAFDAVSHEHFQKTIELSLLRQRPSKLPRCIKLVRPISMPANPASLILITFNIISRNFDRLIEPNKCILAFVHTTLSPLVSRCHA